MTLKLTIIGHDAAGVEPAKTVDHRGVTIGRAPDNDWVLPDPDRHLSKRHCEIAFDNGEYVVTDTSTNGVYLNDAVEPIGRGNRSPLRDGDCLTLGDYRIEARIAPGSPAADATLTTAPASDSFAALLAKDAPTAADDLDPFGIDREVAGGPLSGEPGRPAEPPSEPPPPEPPPSEPPLGGPSASGWPDTDAADRPLEPLIPDDDPLFGGGPDPDDRGQDDWGAATPPDHVPSEQEFFRPPPVTRELIPEDWDEDWDKEGGGDAPIQAPDVPAPPPPPVPAAEAGPAHPPAAEAAADPAAVRAFLAGAGLERSGIADENAAALMYAAGQTFREMVQGLREVLMARSTVKNEFRLDQTMIGPARNNPLKFSVNVDEALAAMLRPAAPGYLPPVEAVQEGFKDIKAHQLAVMAGMQVALTALLERFDPDGLKQRLEKGSVLEGILPGARRARYWELYETFYRQIAEEAEQDFHGLFGRAFARAYEEQVKKL